MKATNQDTRLEEASRNVGGFLVGAFSGDCVRVMITSINLSIAKLQF